MVDSSWNNEGHGMPTKAGMPLWGKIALGCGIVFLVLLVTCVSAGALVLNKFKKDPEGFKRQAINVVADKVRPDWEDFRAVVEQLRSPEGCQALYAANPDLAKTWPTSADFLEASSRWHKEVASAPELSSDLIEAGDLQITREFNGHVRVGWSPKSGRAIRVTFEASRKAGDQGPRHILELDVR
jgi:hypothetical protein